MFLKKQGLAFYMNVAAAVTGIAGLVTLIIGNNLSEANKMNEFGMMAALGVIGILLVCAAAVIPNVMKTNDIVRAVCTYGAIALYTVVLARHINARILLISGLFSWNNMNTVGWQIFYLMIASCVCLLVGVIFMIVGAFSRAVKENA